MSDFTDKDYSLTSSKPVECYWIYSEDEEYFYTSHSQDVVIPAIGTFVPASLSRKEYSFETVPFGASLEIDMDAQEPFIVNNNFRFGKARLFVKAYRVQLDNMAYAEFYSGVVRNIQFHGETATIEVVYFTSQMKNKVLSYSCSKTCPHVLYGFFCKVNKASFTYSGTISSFGINESIIISSIFSNKNVVLGSLYHPITKEVRIINDVGRDALGAPIPNSAQIIRPFTGALVGDTFSLVLGCNKSSNACKNIFDNFRNFGGYENIPVEAPYSEAKIKRYV